MLTLIRCLFHWHVKDPSHSAKSAGGRLQLITHTTMTKRSRCGLTMLSRYSVRTCQGKKLTRNSSGNVRPQSSQLTVPLWTDPWPSERSWCTLQYSVYTPAADDVVPGEERSEGDGEGGHAVSVQHQLRTPHLRLDQRHPRELALRHEVAVGTNHHPMSASTKHRVKSSEYDQASALSNRIQ